MIPAPTTATSAIALSSRSTQGDGDLHVQPLAYAVEVDLAGGSVDLPAVLLGPSEDSFVGAENLGEVALAAADLRESNLARRESLVSDGLRDADLDRTVLLGVDGAVIQHEGSAAFSIALGV